MNFGEALVCLKASKKVSRSKWEQTGLFISLQVPDENSKMRRPYLYVSSASEALTPWAPTQTDILAEDWLEL